jgi:hypothetical protein
MVMMLLIMLIIMLIKVTIKITKILIILAQYINVFQNIIDCLLNVKCVYTCEPSL